MKYPSKIPLYVVLMLNIIQLAIFVIIFPVQLEFSRTGTMPPLAFLLDLISNILLLIGAVFLFWKNKGENIYLISGVILLFAAYLARNLPVPPLIPPSIYTTEILLSFIGWLVIYRFRNLVKKMQVETN